MRKNKKIASENVIPAPEEKKKSVTIAPIKEIEEKLVPIDEVKPNPHRYFVIIGSFRNPENAKKYQGQILKDGFSSEILKNEEGLYRVSVLATDEISTARDDIRRIRNISYAVFTWSRYTELLDVLSQEKFVVLPLNEMRDTFDKSKVVVGLRHDVDHNPFKALEMAQIEKSYGIRSTYYFLSTAEYYGQFNIKKLHPIKIQLIPNILIIARYMNSPSKEFLITF